MNLKSSASRFAIYLLIMGFGLWSSATCRCQNSTFQPGQCDKGTECSERGQTFRKGVCMYARCDDPQTGAADDTKCCPGQRCEAGGLCVDRASACSEDKQCPSGQKCQTLADGARACRFDRPNEAGGCADGMYRFNQRCLPNGTIACQARCGETEICNIETNQCEALPVISTTDSSCEQSCAAGTNKVYSEPDGMIFGRCCALQCTCETLPGIPVGDFGYDAHGVVTPDALAIASYNETYGDLMLTRHDKQSGALISVEFVDGLPTSGAPTADVKGYRRGFTEAGPKVGMSPHIAYLEGTLRMTYFDVDKKQLKYAQKSESGWIIYTLDSRGEVGRSSAIDVSGGVLRVAYVVERGRKLGQAADDTNLYTGVRYAEAKQTNPLKLDDWNFYDVDFRAIRPAPCPACSEPKVCVFTEPSAVEQACVETQTADKCSGAAQSGQVCATVNDRTAWYATNPALRDNEPEANGLFVSMRVQAGKVYLAYLDHVANRMPPIRLPTGQLHGAWAPLREGRLAGDFLHMALDKGEVCEAAPGPVKNSLLTGLFTHLAVAPNGRISIAYVAKEATRARLKLYTAQDGQFTEDKGCSAAPEAGRFDVIDDGTNGACQALPCTSQVGADATLVFSSDNQLRVLYQDQTALGIKMATEKPGAGGLRTFDLQTLSRPAHKPEGFFIHVMQEGSQFWIAHQRIWFSNGPIQKDLAVTPINLFP